MSQEQHPNFQAVGFATQIAAAYHRALRGKMNALNAPDIEVEIVEFADKIERLVDSAAGQKGRPLIEVFTQDFDEDGPQMDEFLERLGQRDITLSMTPVVSLADIQERRFDQK